MATSAHNICSAKVTEEFWRQRAIGYDQLSWAKESGYLRHFLESGRFQSTDKVLDLGCGTGIILEKLRENGIDDVTGLDISPDMLAHARNKTILKDVPFCIGDARELPFAEGNFSKVTARMVLHHVIDDTQRAITEGLRVLQPGGMIIVSEGVPPHRQVKDDYTEIFRHKEARLTLFAEDIEDILNKAGFTSINTLFFVEKEVSIGNWLRYSGLPKYKQEVIMKLHKNASGFFKQVYNMIETADDCLIDMTFAIVTGTKP